MPRASAHARGGTVFLLYFLSISIGKEPALYLCYKGKTVHMKRELREHIIFERAKRAHSLFMSIEISDIYIYIYMFA